MRSCSLIFARPRGGSVKVDAGAVTVMESFRQLEPRDAEAGGVLLGRFIRGTEDIVIDEVTTPTWWDCQSRTSFRRRTWGHQRIIDARWSTSGGTSLYLGEWHSHPEPTPSPSGVDLEDWKRRLRVDDFEGDTLLFLIAGQHTTRAWEGTRSGARVAVKRLKEAKLR